MNRKVRVPGRRLEARIVIPGVGVVEHSGEAIAVFLGKEVTAVAMTPAEGRTFEADTKRKHQAASDDAVISSLEDNL